MSVDRDRLMELLLGRRLRAVDLAVFALLVVGLGALALGAYGDTFWRPMGSDVMQWVKAAEALSRFDLVGFTTLDRPPLYPGLAGALAAAGVDLESAAICTSLLSWAALPGLTWLAGVRMAGRLPAALAVAAVYWSGAASSVAPLFNSQAMFNAGVLLLASVGYLLARSPRPWAAVALGLLAGLLLAVKEQGLVYPPLLALWVLLMVPQAPDGRRPSRWARLGFYLLGLAAPLAGYLYLCVWSYPGGFAATKWGLLARDVGSLLHAADWRDATIAPTPWNQRVSGAQETHSGWLGIWAFSARTVGLWLLGMGHLVWLAALGIFTALLPWGRGVRIAVGWLLVCLAPLFLAATVALLTEYHISFVPGPFALLSAIALSVALRELLRRWPAALGWRHVAPLALAVVIVAALEVNVRRAPAGVQRRLREAAAMSFMADHMEGISWLKEQSDAGALVLTPSPLLRTALEMRGLMEPAPLVGAPELLPAPREGGRVLLAFDDSRFASTRWGVLDSDTAFLRRQPGWSERYNRRGEISGRLMVVAERGR